MSEGQPTWVKVMQNGALGEARAKAFLMDRFWILERSVDIEGADLIIQRKLTDKNLLERAAPKLGYVQVKFFESAKTTHFIPEEYVKDREGKLREDFFLLIFSGFEENAQTYFLSSDQLENEFKLVVNRKTKKYSLPGSKILPSNRYRVSVNSAVLSRIEHQLELADFKKNREFISWKLPGFLSDATGILPEYKEKLDYWTEDIPEKFKEIKQTAIESLKEIEDIFWQLKALVEDIDPMNAVLTIMDLSHNHNLNTFGTWGHEISELASENFYYDCKRHLEKVQNLKNEGILDTYYKARKKLTKEVQEFLISNREIDHDLVYSVQLKFTPLSFEITSIDQKLTPAKEYFQSRKNDYLSQSSLSEQYPFHGFHNVTQSQLEYFRFVGKNLDPQMISEEKNQFYYKESLLIYSQCMGKCML